jgi:hypothetical protein
MTVKIIKLRLSILTRQLIQGAVPIDGGWKVST